MSDVKNLTSKILKDAEEKESSILAAAEEEKSKIILKKKDAAKVLEATMIEKAKSEAQTRKERIISGAELSARNEKLAAKQSVMKDVFEESVEELCKMKDADFKNFLKKSILSLDIDGDETLILNENGKKLIDSNFVKAINEELVSKGKSGKIALSEEVANFKGGFILEKNGIEINNTFEALVKSLREELEFEVANVLFN